MTQKNAATSGASDKTPEAPKDGATTTVPPVATTNPVSAEKAASDKSAESILTEAKPEQGGPIPVRSGFVGLTPVEGKEPIAPPRGAPQPDHSSLREKKDDPKRQEKRDRQNRSNAGNLPGKFFTVGSTILREDAIVSIELPREGEEFQTMVITLLGGKAVVVAGEELADIMGDMGLKFLPPLPSSHRATVQEDGRLLSPHDVVANSDPSRVQTVPVGPKPMPENTVLPKSPTNEPTTQVHGKRGKASEQKASDTK